MHINDADSSRLRHHWIVFAVLNIVFIPTLADTRKPGKHTLVFKSYSVGIIRLEWVFTGNLNDGRMWHSGTMLRNGKLLVTGGVGNAG